MNKDKIKIILTWLFILPGAVLAAFASMFPIHWVLYLKSHTPGLDGLFWNISTTESIEIFISPFVYIITFILVGGNIAPKYKFATSIILSLLVIIPLIVSYSPSDHILEYRGLVAVLLAIFISWKWYGNNGQQNEESIATIK